MSDHPELPWLAAGTVGVVGATIRDGRIPDITVPAIATVLLVLIASATADTRYAPLVRALGMLLLLAAVIAATNVVLKKGKNRG